MPGFEHDGLVERVAEIGADERWFGAVGPGTVREVEVRQPRTAVAAGRGDRGAREVACGGAGLGHVERGGHDVAPAPALVAPMRVGRLADDPGVPVVRHVALVGEAVVDPHDVATGELVAAS